MFNRTILHGVTNVFGAVLLTPRDDDESYQFYDDYFEEEGDYVNHEHSIVVKEKIAVYTVYMLRIYPTTALLG